MARRTYLLALAAVGLGLALPASGMADDWPQYGRTPDRAGRAVHERQLGLDRLAALHVAFAGRYGTNATDQSSPVVANGIAYVAGADGAVSAFALAGCGQAECPPLWEAHTRNDITSTPAVAAGVLLVASADDRLYAFRARGCRESPCPPLWKGRLDDGSVESPIAVAGGDVYVGTYAGTLDVFPLAGCGQRVCQPAWRGQAGGHLVNGAAVAGGSVFIPSDDGHLYSFAAAGCGAASCAPRWTADLGGPPFDVTPTVHRGLVFVQAAAGDPPEQDLRVAAFRARGCGAPTCLPLWEGELGLDGYAGAAAVAGDHLYVASQHTPQAGLNVGVVSVFDIRGCGRPLCDALWTDVNFASGFESSPVLAGGAVYVAKGPASGFPVDVGVFAYDAAGCGAQVCEPLAFVQTAESAFYLSSSLAAADGRLLFGANDNDEDGGASKLYVLSTAP